MPGLVKMTPGCDSETESTYYIYIFIRMHSLLTFSFTKQSKTKSKTNKQNNNRKWTDINYICIFIIIHHCIINNCLYLSTYVALRAVLSWWSQSQCFCPLIGGSSDQSFQWQPQRGIYGGMLWSASPWGGSAHSLTQTDSAIFQS